jgi:hypothetical protein
MTDYRQIVFPVHRGEIPKYRDYDVSDGARINNGVLSGTANGGNDINLTLLGSYDFNWVNVRDFFFLKLENNG